MFRPKGGKRVKHKSDHAHLSHCASFSLCVCVYVRVCLNVSCITHKSRYHLGSGSMLLVNTALEA